MDQTKIAEREYSAAAGRLFAGDDAPLRNPLFGLGSSLIDEFREAELLRKEAEDRWLKDLRQYKGQYEAEEEAKEIARRSQTRLPAFTDEEDEP